MRIQLDTRTLLFGVFILGAIVSFVFYTFSNTTTVTDNTVSRQLEEADAHLSDAQTLYQNCRSLKDAGTNAPTSVRSGCIESHDLVYWARSYPFDAKLSGVRSAFLTLAGTIEDMTDAMSFRPTSEVAQKDLDQIPAELTAVETEIANAKKTWWQL